MWHFKSLRAFVSPTPFSSSDTAEIVLFSGFITDQKEYELRMQNKTHPPTRQTGPGMAEPVERFQLNNLSFAGPVIMGVGGSISQVLTLSLPRCFGANS